MGIGYGSLVFVITSLFSCGGAQPVSETTPERVEPSADDEQAVAFPPKPPVVAQPEPEPEPEPPAAPPGPRRGGDLVVHDPPRAPTRAFGGRMRAHTEGALTLGSQRIWVGPPVPEHVELVVGTRQLHLLDPHDDGHVATYRDPYGAGSCGLRSAVNCAVLVRNYGHDGQVVWEIDLAGLYSRPDRLEVQDVRLADGVLYFNEGCQSYSSGARGRCSSLVAVDPTTGNAQWRTRPLISNNVFLVLDDWIIAGYGFTSERDYLSIVRRTDGRVMQRVRLESAHRTFAIAGNGQLEVTDYDQSTYRFEPVGFDGPRPRLRRVSRTGGRGVHRRRGLPPP